MSRAEIRVTKATRAILDAVGPGTNVRVVQAAIIELIAATGEAAQEAMRAEMRDYGDA